MRNTTRSEDARITEAMEKLRADLSKHFRKAAGAYSYDGKPIDSPSVTVQVHDNGFVVTILGKIKDETTSGRIKAAKNKKPKSS